MMIAAVELEEISLGHPQATHIVYDGREIGSTAAIGEKLSQLKLSRTDDPHYVVFVRVDKSGECLLTAFSMMGGPAEYRTRHRLGAFPGIGKNSAKARAGSA